ncbi:hypothetical protein PCCS19_29700 [Paenibacillus sp. CCS19]|nr:hypothetical protein PCCS19_29700 [Paenibacillus cellulosilyticus]
MTYAVSDDSRSSITNFTGVVALLPLFPGAAAAACVLPSNPNSNANSSSIAPMNDRCSFI